MWMVDPKIMCAKHLLGEHVELHMLMGTLRKGNKIDGYITNDLIEPKSIFARHAALVEEMKHRGYNHRSPLAEQNWEDLYLIQDLPVHILSHSIDRDRSLEELLHRCTDCQKRHISQ
jgi:hypothetical protein